MIFGVGERSKNASCQPSAGIWELQISALRKWCGYHWRIRALYVKSFCFINCTKNNIFLVVKFAAKKKNLHKCKNHYNHTPFPKNFSHLQGLFTFKKSGKWGMKESDEGGFVYHAMDVSYVWKKKPTIL